MTADLTFDDELTESDPSMNGQVPPKPTPNDAWKGIRDAWNGQPKVVRWGVQGVAGFLILMVLIGKCSGGGGEEPVSSPTSTTLDTGDPLVGLPTLAPIVASSVRPEDRFEFANRVRQVTSDGSSLCDVYFGITVQQTADGASKIRWSVTTPKWQQASGTGVQLPSSEWPIRAFYGPPCNVADKDVSLATTTTTTTAAPGE